MHFNYHLLYIYYMQDMALVTRNKTLSLPSRRDRGGKFLLFKELLCAKYSSS